MITSLEVASWPMICWSAQNIHRLNFVHFESLPDHDHASSELWSGPSGRSVWGSMSGSGMVGLAWQWAQLSPGVFALLDPMAIESNLVLLASDGSRLSPMATSMVLNCVVARMDWQPEASRSVRHCVAPRIDAVQLQSGQLAS